MVASWTQNISALHTILNNVFVSDKSGNALGSEAAFGQWKEKMLEIRTKNKTIYFVGNGASASMASHFAADTAKNGGFRTRVFTDLSLITAIANDISYEEVFAEPLRWYMEKGDMLVAISSSGNSPNVVRAVQTAGDAGGIVITLSAMGEDNAIRKKGDLNFYVSAQSYGLAETAHAAILHYWMDMIENSSKCL